MAYQHGITVLISIHALREEGDVVDDGHLEALEGFLSTPSARRATPAALQLRATPTFLSTPSARRATRSSGHPLDLFEFLSTPSARRATTASCWRSLPRPISIHALREEGDRGLPTSCRPHRNFYPRPPRGGRRTQNYNRRHCK